MFLAAWRTGAGMALAGGAAVALGLNRPYWAMLAVIAVLAQGVYATLANQRAYLRAAGCVIGCVLAIPVLWWHPHGYAAALLVGVLMFLIEMVAARNHALAMVFITPLSVFLASSAGPALLIGPTIATLLANTALGCLAGIVAGQFVSRNWVHNQRFRAIADTLKAAESALIDERHVARLRKKRAKAQLIAQRSVAERAAVAQTAKAWNEIADHAERVVEQVLASPPDGHEGLTAEIRHVRDRAEHHWQQRRPGT